MKFNFNISKIIILIYLITIFNNSKSEQYICNNTGSVYEGKELCNKKCYKGSCQPNIKI